MPSRFNWRFNARRLVPAHYCATLQLVKSCHSRGTRFGYCPRPEEDRYMPLQTWHRNRRTGIFGVLYLVSLLACSGRLVDYAGSSGSTGRGAACTSRADCETSLVCFEGTCHGSCGGDTDCIGGEVCDVQQGVCMPGSLGGCSAAQDCDGDGVCLADECWPPCVSGACVPGRVCLHDACVTGSCGSSVDCAGTLVCSDGSCLLPCTTTADCMAGEDCQAGACVSVIADVPTGGSCQSDAQCLDNGSCINGVCRAPCNAGSCPSGEVCDAGFCVPDTLGDPCSSASDCVATQVCRDSVCRAGCQSAADCTTGEVCDAGACVPKPCSVASDCQSGQVCVGGVCLGDDGSSCTSNAQCANTCIAGVCAPQSDPGGSCDVSDDADCTAAATCSTSGICLLPDGQACTGNSECIHTCIAGVCSPLGGFGDACDTNDSADCAGGASCIGNVCSADPCASISCPANQRCTAGTCYDCPALDCVACNLSRDCGVGMVCRASSCTVINCVGDTDCNSGEVCVGGVCQAGGSPCGAVICVGLSRCESGFCQPCPGGDCAAIAIRRAGLTTGAGVMSNSQFSITGRVVVDVAGGTSSASGGHTVQSGRRAP